MTLGDSWKFKAASSTQESKNFWIICSEPSLTVSIPRPNGAAEHHGSINTRKTRHAQGEKLFVLKSVNISLFMQVKLVLLLFCVWGVLCAWVSFGWLVWGFVLGFLSGLGCGVDFCAAGW